MKKLKKEDEMNVPLSAVLAPLSDSWRRRYERLGISSTILGDHRGDRCGNEYPYFDIKKEHDKCFIRNDDMNDGDKDGSKDDHKMLRKEKESQVKVSALHPWVKTFTTKPNSENLSKP